MSRLLQLTATLTLIGTAAHAQPVAGTWTGYVNGWVPDSRPATPILLDRTTVTRRVTEQQRQVWIYNQLAAQQAFFAQQAIAAQAKEQDRQREVEARAAEQRLFEQQQALFQQQQAAQAQLLAEQQQLAAQREQLRLEQERRELEVARAKLAEEQERAAKAAAIAAQQAEEAKKLAAAAPRDETPGPPIHKWVDEDGVTHFSTRPRR